jgi:hypothetical protein
MKVIKEGRHPGSQVMRGTCQRCGCIIECARSECKVDHDPREQRGVPYVACPTCGGSIYTAPFSEPARWQEKD